MKKVLVNIFFETGESTCPYWVERLVVQTLDIYDTKPLTKNIKKIIENIPVDADLTYTEIAEEIIDNLPNPDVAKMFAFNTEQTIANVIDIFT